MFMVKPVAAERKPVPRPCIATLMLWVMGVDVREHMSERTYWRHRQMLRDCGYDLSKAFSDEDYPGDFLVEMGGFDLSAFRRRSLNAALSALDARNGVGCSVIGA